MNTPAASTTGAHRNIDGALYRDIDHRVAAYQRRWRARLDAAGDDIIERSAYTPARAATTPRVGDTVYRITCHPQDIRPGIVTAIGPGPRDVTVRWLSAESIIDHSSPERTDALCLLVPDRPGPSNAADRITIIRRSVRRADGSECIEPTGLQFDSAAAAETALHAIAIAKHAFGPHWTSDYLGPAPHRLCIDWALHEEFYEVHQIDQQ